MDARGWRSTGKLEPVFQTHIFLQFFLVVSFRYFPWHNCYNNNTTDISNYFDCYDYDSYQVQDHDQD